MASSFKIGEKFNKVVKDLMNKESSISEELREELENLKSQSTVPFKTVRKLHKLLQANGKRIVSTDKSCLYLNINSRFYRFVLSAGNPVYLHELFEDSTLYLPEVITPPRVSEKEAVPSIMA